MRTILTTLAFNLAVSTFVCGQSVSVNFTKHYSYNDGKDGNKTEWGVSFTNTSRSDVRVRWKFTNEPGGYSLSDIIHPGATYKGHSWSVPTGRQPEVDYTVELENSAKEQPANRPSATPQALPDRKGGRGETTNVKSPEQQKWEKERLTGEQVAAACKNYYATQGEWAGVFRITTVNNSKVISHGGGRYTVYLKYSYLGIGGGRQGETGEDARTFEIIATPGGGCRVLGMGAYQSGTF